MLTGTLGMMVNPTRQQGGEDAVISGGATWAIDCGAFAATYPGDDAYVEWLSRRPQISGCLFAVAPDAICDHQRTYRRSARLIPRISELGFPVAFVGQNGARPYNVPWSTFDVLFLGGDDEWKLGPAARGLVEVARSLGKRVHMGRVNSRQRFRYAQEIGCDSVDGTFLVRAPRINLPRLRRWIDEGRDQMTLWTPPERKTM